MLQKSSSYNGEQINAWDSEEKHVKDEPISVFHRFLFKSVLKLLFIYLFLRRSN